MNALSPLHALPLENFEHLHASTTRFLPFGRGNCFQRSVAMVMDEPRAKLVIGTIKPKSLHAWVELGRAYCDPSRFEEDGGLVLYEKQQYLVHTNTTVDQTVRRKDIMSFAKRGRLSPWMLKTDNTHHTLNGTMGEVLLDELNIPYRTAANGFIYSA